MSIVENLGCVFFLYFPKVSINDLQIQKFCPKKNFALWIELSTELNQNRSFQALNIWQSKYDQNSCHSTSNETCTQHQKKHLHERHRELPLYISFRTSLLSFPMQNLWMTSWRDNQHYKRIFMHGFYQLSLKMCTFCDNICNVLDV